jgi:hypothetical protein
VVQERPQRLDTTCKTFQVAPIDCHGRSPRASDQAVVFEDAVDKEDDSPWSLGLGGGCVPKRTPMADHSKHQRRLAAHALGDSCPSKPVVPHQIVQSFYKRTSKRAVAKASLLPNPRQWQQRMPCDCSCGKPLRNCDVLGLDTLYKPKGSSLTGYHLAIENRRSDRNRPSILVI